MGEEGWVVVWLEPPSPPVWGEGCELKVNKCLLGGRMGLGGTGGHRGFRKNWGGGGEG